MAQSIKGSGEAGLLSAKLDKRPEEAAEKGRVIGWDGTKQEAIHAAAADPEVIALDPCTFCGDVHIIAFVPKRLDDWQVGDPCPFRLRREDTKKVYNPVVLFCREIEAEGDINLTVSDRDLLDMFYRYLDEIGSFES